MVAFFGLAGLLVKGGSVLAFAVSWSFIGRGMDEGGQGTVTVFSTLAAIAGYLARQKLVESDAHFFVSRPVIASLQTFALLAMLAIFSGWVMETNDQRAINFLGLLIANMLMAIVIADYAREADGFRLLMIAFVFAAGVTSITSLAQAGPLDNARLGMEDGLRRVGNSISIGIAALFTLIFFKNHLGGAVGGRAAQLIFYLASVALFAVLLLTASRGNLLGVTMAFSTGILLMFRRDRISQQTLVICLTAILGLTLTSLLFNPGEALERAFPVVAGRVGVDAINDPRVAFWQEAILNTDWTVFIIGGGIHSWSNLNGIDVGFGAHSFFFDVLYVAGVPGLLIVAEFFRAMIKSAWRTQQEWAILWIAFFISSFATYGTVYRPAHWIVIGVILAAAFRATAIKNMELDPRACSLEGA